MNCKERVIAAINGLEVDHVPSSFSYHFPECNGYGEAGAEAHLKFFRETDTDIYKIMNENLVPYMGDIKNPDDWKQIRSFTIKDGFMVRQTDMVQRILERCGPNHFTMGTLHGALASCIHPLEPVYGYEGARRLMVEHYRQKKQPVKDAFARVTDGMARLAEEYIRIGVDAVYYAALGAEEYYYTDEEFAELVESLDKLILKAVRDAGGYCFLHMCKDKLVMNRYKSYAPYADVVNWGIYEVPMTLEEGRELFPGKTIMGGLANRSGILMEGPIIKLRDSVKRIITNYGKKGFILGADCTLPTGLPNERIRAAVVAAREI